MGSGAGGMFLSGAQEQLSRFAIIVDLAIADGQADVGGFIARVEAQDILICGDRTGEIVRRCERGGQFVAQLWIFGRYFDGAAEFVDGIRPILLRGGLLGELLVVAGGQRFGTRRRLAACCDVKNDPKNKQHGADYNIEESEARVEAFSLDSRRARNYKRHRSK